jgi:hypothetical protein
VKISKESGFRRDSFGGRDAFSKDGKSGVGCSLNPISRRRSTLHTIDYPAAFSRRQAKGEYLRKIHSGRKEGKREDFSEIPLIAFLLFEESKVPLKRGIGERIIDG